MKKVLLGLLLVISSSVFNLCKAQDWDSVSSGVASSIYSGEVLALAVYNGELYVAGIFDKAGGVPASNIAKWNGTSWSAVGAGITGILSRVYALTVYNGNLYAGGSFDSAGGKPASNLAMWNGTAWSAVASQMNGPYSYSDVYCSVVYNGNLYIGGYFDTINGIPANNIASWNGTFWNALGAGTNDAISSLTTFDSVLYAGGPFDSAGGKPINAIAQWDGSTWSPLGSGLVWGGIATANARTLCMYKGDLYVGGNFDTAGGIPAQMLAKWNGSAWDSVIPYNLTNEGLDYVSAMMVTNGLLLVGGKFDAIGIPANDIATFDGTKWDSLGHGFSLLDSGEVSALDIYNSVLYAGGDIIASGNTQLHSIARWEYPTGISLITSPTNTLSVYPNPSNGIFNVSIRNSELEIRNIVVFNVLGEQVYSTPFTIYNSQFTIDMSSNPNGIYFLKVTTANGETLTQKVSVVR